MITSPRNDSTPHSGLDTMVSPTFTTQQEKKHLVAPPATNTANDYTICLHCNQYCKDSSVECCKCTYWSHYVCLNLSAKDIEALEKPDSIFICHSCEQLQDFIDCELSTYRAPIPESLPKYSNVEEQPVLVPNMSNIPNGRECGTGTPNNRGVSNNFKHTVSLPSRASNADGGRKNTPASVTTNNNTNTDYVHRSEVENKQKVLRASENKSD